MPNLPRYNERAWAIDVIVEINAFCQSRQRAIRRAGGEYTLIAPTKRLFPDVLLFGDSSGSQILQGWELKMPDTAITDNELLANAETKAKRLGLNSFLVWNVNEAALYKKTTDPTASFALCHSWSAINILSRGEVEVNRSRWINLLHNIIDDLNDFIEDGEIIGSRPELVFKDSLFIDFLSIHEQALADLLKEKAVRNSALYSLIDIWWGDNAEEHKGSNKYSAIARVNIINWINRFLFAHYLRRFNSASNIITTITKDTSIGKASQIFEQISQNCDFMNVFRAEVGSDDVDDDTWTDLIALNSLLKGFELQNIPQESFQLILEQALTSSRKKLAGQFSTPKPLANLLVQSTVRDWTQSILDPCCGTGTIGRSVYETKKNRGLSISDSLRTTWGSDKYRFPLQLCSIALSDPEGIGEVVQIF